MFQIFLDFSRIAICIIDILILAGDCQKVVLDSRSGKNFHEFLNTGKTIYDRQCPDFIVIFFKGRECLRQNLCSWNDLLQAASYDFPHFKRGYFPFKQSNRRKIHSTCLFFSPDPVKSQMIQILQRLEYNEIFLK
ncbi:MAG: hypothetical protein BWY31_04697 [Lentisphaerae bacterium ADurb.Bin242]|nr:MAG: hypothetical protein BWY31_04697 [Lentisphaerae bacterium ADurb.Bin242]